MPGCLRKSPSSTSHRRQSFCFVLSVPLLLSKSPHHARESVGRRSSPSIITDGAAPANPSPREQVCSRPTVGVSVRGHRQRAQGRRKSLPETTCQRSARTSCCGVRAQFGPRGRNTYLARLQWQPSRSRLDQVDLRSARRFDASVPPLAGSLVCRSSRRR